MQFAVFLWIMVWGGMFSGIYNIKSPHFLSSPLAIFQGTRALLPIFSTYLVLLWILATKSRLSILKTPMGFLLSYCFVGIISSLFLSPDKLTSMYWASAYLAPLLAVGICFEQKDILESLKKILHINYAIIIFITLTLVPEVIRMGTVTSRFSPFYALPFHLGEMRANGVGRFALVTIIVSFVRLVTKPGKLRLTWILIMGPSLFLLAQTRSRTSLLGLAVASIFFVLLKGLNWRLLFVGPLSAYIIWVSAIQWRLHGEVEKIIILSGREYTWQRGFEQIKESPFFGWGFHADRILLNSEHMHNSYLHAAIHSGLIGAFLFLSALVGIWIYISRSNLLRRVREVQGEEQALLMESILILAFLSERSLFESTGAFYGVDLLLLVPAMSYLLAWVQTDSLKQNEENLGTGPIPGVVSESAQA